MLYFLFLLGLVTLITGIVVLVRKSLDKKFGVPIVLVGVILMFSTAPFIDTEENVSSKDEENKVDNEVKELTTEEKIEEIVIDILGAKTNMKKDRIQEIQIIEDYANIHVHANENLTVDLAKRGMWRDSIKLIEKLATIEDIRVFHIVWYGDFIDIKGNTSTSKVMQLEFPRDVINDINFENVDYNNAPKIATFYWQHKALE